MKALVAAALLLALASPAHAITCTGRVKVDVATVSEGLRLKGDRIVYVDGCAFVNPAPILRKCPAGSRCRVEGGDEEDGGIEKVISATRIDPSEFRESDRKWHPVMEEWADTYDPCLKRQWEDGEEAEHKAWCKRHDAAEKKLIAHGYCVYANGGVGRPSKDRKHCYTIDWPVPEHVRYLQGRQ